MPRNKFNKTGERLYTENNKTFLKVIKKELHKWKDIPSSQIGRLNNVKMVIFAKTIYKFNAIPVKF